MRRFTFISFICLTLAVNCFSQKETGPFVSKPIYSDLSPPLRSMKDTGVVVTESRKAEKAEREIWNYFRKVQKRNHSGKYHADPYRQNFFGNITPDSVIRNFEGTANVNGALPPDTYGEAGRDYYIHMVNLSFTVFDKSGNILLGPLNTSTLWNGLPYNGNSGDGTVMYDEQADRWFITNYYMPNYPSGPYFIMIGISQTPDPTGSWYRWEYQFDNIPDYPKFGIWRDAYFMTCNRFISPIYYDGVGAVAFDRTAMLAGEASPSMVLFKYVQNQNVFSLLPADCDGSFPAAGTPGYFAYADNDFLGLFEFHTDWIHPDLSTFGNLKKIGIGSYTSIQGVPQKGSDILLDAVSGRLMCRLQFRNFSDHECMVVNHTIQVGDKQAGIRWYEMRRYGGDWILYQKSTYAPDSNSRWMGSIAMDSAGNIALGYSVSGPALYPSIRFTGRMKNDPPGQMTIAEHSITEGGGAQTHPATYASRWGDYSSMSIDPSNRSVFWYTQQYYPVTADYNWHTRIASFSFADILSVDAIAVSPNICPGQSDSLDVEVTGGNGNYAFSWISVPPGFTSDIRNPVVSPSVTTRYIVVVSSGTQVRTDTLQVNVTPPASVFAGDDTVCCRHIGEILLSGEADNYVSVKWQSKGDGSFSDPFSLFTKYLPGNSDRAGSLIDLELIVYPQPPCPVVSGHKLIIMDTCSGIPSILPGNSMNIFPNPGTGIFTISLPVNSLMIEISDLPGKRIFSADLSSFKEKAFIIDLSDKPRGMYPVRVILKDGIICDKLVLR